MQFPLELQKIRRTRQVVHLSIWKCELGILDIGYPIKLFKN